MSSVCSSSRADHRDRRRGRAANRGRDGRAPSADARAAGRASGDRARRGGIGARSWSWRVCSWYSCSWPRPAFGFPLPDPRAVADSPPAPVSFGAHDAVGDLGSSARAECDLVRPVVLFLPSRSRESGVIATPVVCLGLCAVSLCWRFAWPAGGWSEGTMALARIVGECGAPAKARGSQRIRALARGRARPPLPPAAPATRVRLCPVPMRRIGGSRGRVVVVAVDRCGCQAFR